MGTRGAIGFRIDGIDKVTYNHFDSYPSCLGIKVVEFCRQTKNVDLKPFARGIRLVDENTSAPTPDEIKKYREFFRADVSENTEEEWYSLLREAQGDLQPYVDGLDVMIDSKGFLLDSLFCEWAYIVNLDDGTLEVYEGFNKDPRKPGRYAGASDKPDDHGYWGVKLIRTVPLAEIDDFDIVAECETEED